MCVIKEQCQKRPKQIAIIDRERKISYEELNQMIEGSSFEASPFVASKTLESVIRILFHLRYNFLLVLERDKEPHRILPIPNERGIFIATSGSTGPCKWVMHSEDHLKISALNPHPDLVLKGEDLSLLSLPLYHISGLMIMYRAFIQGSTLLISPSPFEDKVTHLSFVPTQLKRYLEGSFRYTHLKAMLIGGAPIPHTLCQRAHKENIPLYLTYGMSEMASQIATKRFDPHHGVTFGYPLPERELKIEGGEIFVKGPMLFYGYYPHSFQEPWFPTKDLGHFGPHGLIIDGRKDRRIISGGEKIHLEEIEKALTDIREIESFLVYSRQDETWGERPCMKIKKTTSLSREELIYFLKQALPSYKIPFDSDIEFTEENLSSKPLKI